MTEDILQEDVKKKTYCVTKKGKVDHLAGYLLKVPLFVSISRQLVKPKNGITEILQLDILMG